jgi:hypothetical protein
MACPEILRGMVKEDGIAAAAGRRNAEAFLGRYFTRTDPRSSALIAPGLTEHHNGIAHFYQYGREVYTAPASAQAVGETAKQRSAANFIIWTMPTPGSNVPID